MYAIIAVETESEMVVCDAVRLVLRLPVAATIASGYAEVVARIASAWTPTTSVSMDRKRYYNQAVAS